MLHNQRICILCICICTSSNQARSARILVIAESPALGPCSQPRLSHRQLLHTLAAFTQLFYTQLSHTQLVDTHTQLFHNFVNSTLAHTQLFHPRTSQCSHASQLFHTQLLHFSILHHLLCLSFLPGPASISMSDYWNKLTCGVILSLNYIGYLYR